MVNRLDLNGEDHPDFERPLHLSFLVETYLTRGGKSTELGIHVGDQFQPQLGDLVGIITPTPNVVNNGTPVQNGFRPNERVFFYLPRSE